MNVLGAIDRGGRNLQQQMLHFVVKLHAPQTPPGSFRIVLILLKDLFQWPSGRKGVIFGRPRIDPRAALPLAGSFPLPVARFLVILEHSEPAATRRGREAGCCQEGVALQGGGGSSPSGRQRSSLRSATAAPPNGGADTLR